jgi:2-polyprenyl-6-methoxyphenol hydroxylase-like FAD-dependent oxidoreductase
MLGYPVPGAADQTAPGRRRYNFVWYRPANESTLAAMQTDAAGRPYPEGISPQSIRPELVSAMQSDSEALLAPQLAEVVRLSQAPFFQPIYDVTSPAIAFGRAALLGDAAFVARPHVGMGAIKAAEDAMALADALATVPLDDALATDDRGRRAAGAAVVAESARLGAYLSAWASGPTRPPRRDPVTVMRKNGVWPAPA